MAKYKALDLFAGLGGFRVGSSMYLNLDFVGFSEINQDAISAYKFLWGESENNLGDITKVDEKTVPDHDILFAGFPCQAFSITGHRKGFDDTRGTLFFDVARIMKEKQPKVALLENVKGLINHNNGETFKVILETLTEIGYDYFYGVLNSKNYYVPQHRERIYIVCFRKDLQVSAFEFPRQETKFLTIKNILESAIDYSKYKFSDKKLEYVKNKILNKPLTEPLNKMWEVSNHTPSNFNTGRLYDWNGIVGTLTTSGQVGIWQSKRKFTERELFRLQGYPDYLKIPPLSYNKIYKLVGNSVSPPVIGRLLRVICDILESKNG